MGTRNTLEDLNNHLFMQLERLNEDDLEGERLSDEINRSKALSDISKNIIENGKLVLEAQKFKHDDRMDANRTVPRMLESKKE
mgnify:CR=1 FL=1